MVVQLSPQNEKHFRRLNATGNLIQSIGMSSTLCISRYRISLNLLGMCQCIVTQYVFEIRSAKIYVGMLQHTAFCLVLFLPNKYQMHNLWNSTFELGFLIDFNFPVVLFASIQILGIRLNGTHSGMSAIPSVGIEYRAVCERSKTLPFLCFRFRSSFYTQCLHGNPAVISARRFVVEMNCFDFVPGRLRCDLLRGLCAELLRT